MNLCNLFQAASCQDALASQIPDSIGVLTPSDFAFDSQRYHATDNKSTAFRNYLPVGHLRTASRRIRSEHETQLVRNSRGRGRLHGHGAADGQPGSHCRQPAITTLRFAKAACSSAKS